MERLTKRENGFIDIGDEGTIEGCIQRLAYFEDLQEQGRLVELPDYPQDMDNILEPLKVQSALNSEILKLEFRKKNNPDDVSMLDYTIIMALNKVLQESSGQNG